MFLCRQISLTQRRLQQDFEKNRYVIEVVCSKNKLEKENRQVKITRFINCTFVSYFQPFLIITFLNPGSRGRVHLAGQPGGQGRSSCVYSQLCHKVLDQNFSDKLKGSFRIRFFCLDPDPVFKFLQIQIRVRFSNFSRTGSGFSPPDLDPRKNKNEKGNNF